MLCAKYNLQSERTFETPCISRKITFSSIGFLFYAYGDRVGSDGLSDQFSLAQDHILLKNRLNIKEGKKILRLKILIERTQLDQ